MVGRIAASLRALLSVRQTCSYHELTHTGLAFAGQAHSPVSLDDLPIAADFRVDSFVKHRALPELKLVEQLLLGHEAGTLTDQHQRPCEVGLPLNIDVASLNNGIEHFVLTNLGFPFGSPRLRAAWIDPCPAATLRRHSAFNTKGLDHGHRRPYTPDR